MVLVLRLYAIRNISIHTLKSGNFGIKSEIAVGGNNLVVNRKTAFEIDWLWQQTLHILHGHSNFNAVTLSYNGNVFDIF